MRMLLCAWNSHNFLDTVKSIEVSSMEEATEKCWFCLDEEDDEFPAFDNAEVRLQDDVSGSVWRWNEDDEWELLGTVLME